LWRPQVKCGGGFQSGASDLDPATRDACKRRGGGERRPTAVAGSERWRDSPATPIQGSGARFEARVASMRGARAREARWGGGHGGVAARRTDGATARLKISGDGSKATGCTGTPSSGTEGPLTSLRSSWAISRRRSGGRTGESTAAVGTRSRVPVACG
jgi:hypothetical protein